MNINTVHYESCFNLGEYENERLRIVAAVPEQATPEVVLKLLREKMIQLAYPEFQTLSSTTATLKRKLRKFEELIEKKTNEWNATANFLRTQGMNPNAPDAPLPTDRLIAGGAEAEPTDDTIFDNSLDALADELKPLVDELDSTVENNLREFVFEDLTIKQIHYEGCFNTGDYQNERIRLIAQPGDESIEQAFDQLRQKVVSMASPAAVAIARNIKLMMLDVQDAEEQLKRAEQRWTQLRDFLISQGVTQDLPGLFGEGSDQDDDELIEIVPEAMSNFDDFVELV